LDISLDLAPSPRRVEVVQRTEGEAATEEPTTKEEKQGVDLDDLARQIYPLIKRMLAVEQERRSAR
jgi:hypothetical protein